MRWRHGQRHRNTEITWHNLCFNCFNRNCRPFPVEFQVRDRAIADGIFNQCVIHNIISYPKSETHHALLVMFHATSGNFTSLRDLVSVEFTRKHQKKWPCYTRHWKNTSFFYWISQPSNIWFFQLPQATAADSDLSSRGQNVCSGLMDMVLADLAEVLSMHSVFSCYQITVICCFMLFPNWKHHHPVVNWFAPRKVRYCGLSFYFFIIFMVNWLTVYHKSTSLQVLPWIAALKKKWSVFLGGLVPTVHTQVVSSKHSKHCALAVLEPILIRCNGGV